MYDFQKASSWKRISAMIFDFILVGMLAIGVAWLLSAALGYDTHYNVMEDAKARYEVEYGITLDITAEEYAALSDAERAVYDAANEAFGTDKEVLSAYSMLINLTLIIITFSILIAYFIFELMIPLILGNGQTLGKKVFGIGVMREDGVRLSPLFLFIRTVLGKFTIEVMMPVLSVVMIYFGLGGLFSIVVLFGIPLMQIVFILSDKARTPIHDKLAHTVTVDLASQMIFESPEALLEYKKRIHEDAARGAEYP